MLQRLLLLMTLTAGLAVAADDRAFKAHCATCHPSPKELMKRFADAYSATIWVGTARQSG